MLFVGRTQLSKEQIASKFKFDLKKIMKNPSFEVASHRKKIDRINGGVIKTGKGMGSRSHFMATDPDTGLKVEIRYAQSHVPKQVGNVLQDVFEPRYVEFMGSKKAFQNDPELAIYWFLHPNNALSPLRDKNNKTKPKIEYIDVKKRALDKNAGIDALTDALSHAKSLSGIELVILAKGLGLKGIKGKEEDDVRADVREFASKFPKLYNEKVATRTTELEGKIWHLVDEGVMKLSTIGTTRRWSWAKGEREGEFIVDIINVNQDARVALKNHIFSDLNNYMNALNHITETLTANEKAQEYLNSLDAKESIASESVTIGNGLPDYLKTNTVEEKMPETFMEAVEYLTKKNGGQRPSNAAVSKWLKELKVE